MVKNLEQLNLHELNYLQARIDADIIDATTCLYPNHPDGSGHITAKVGQWIINRKMDLEFSAKDRPELAVIFKKACFRIWQQLPESARCVHISWD